MTRWTLPPGEIPSAWFNVAPYLPTPLQAPLHPVTREPLARVSNDHGFASLIMMLGFSHWWL
jgi:predicted alternative tryptophan synthase beta-subunit